MNRREKILVVAFGSFLTVAAIWWLVGALLLSPIRSAAAEVEKVRQQNDKLIEDNARIARLLPAYQKLALTAFATDANQASIRVNARINQLARLANIRQEDLAISNATATRMGSKNFQDLGCTVTVKRATLESMTHFLYLMDKDASLHQISRLTVLPRDNQRREVGFNFGYSTLVLDQRVPQTLEADFRRLPTTTSAPAPASLAGEERARYDVIVKRNFFMPYVPSTPEPPVVASGNNTPPSPGDPPRPPRPPSSDSPVITGLPQAGDICQVHLAKPGREPTIYNVGDELLLNGKPLGRIVMVDYRPLPKPDNPAEKSDARVILRIGPDFSAIDLGQSLDQRRVLKTNELPDELKPPVGAAEPASRPAERM